MLKCFTNFSQVRRRLYNEKVYTDIQSCFVISNTYNTTLAKIHYKQCSDSAGDICCQVLTASSLKEIVFCLIDNL